MRVSQFLLPTTKEAPGEAELISHQLMLRAGMIRKLAAGIYSYLPLGLRVMRKIETIVREEMDRAGGQEVLLPAVQPAELWRESGRWEIYGKELLRFRDRHDRDFCIGPTHEEVITDIVRREVRSYRQLPLLLYQIQTKFRDEIRPRFGLMRGREFSMKDAYSFDLTEEEARRSYALMYDTYQRIFARCGLTVTAVEADTGPIGGAISHEFMVLAESGEDAIVACGVCSYAANAEKATSGPDPTPVTAGPPGPLVRVHTPGVTSVTDVARFCGVAPRDVIKTVVFATEQGSVAALVRGDDEVNRTKLKNVLGAVSLEMAAEAGDVPLGFVGPVGWRGRLVADTRVRLLVNAMCGANEVDYHYQSVVPGRDFAVDTYADIRLVAPGDPCAQCGAPLEGRRGIEVGHIFQLGTKYSKALGASVLTDAGDERPLVMGCYGIGIGRTVAAAVEQYHDEAGIIFPPAIAPYAVHIVSVNPTLAAIRETADRVYAVLGAEGIEVLYDDRDERAGVKFKDADLIGVPLRVTVGERALAQGAVELRVRRTGEMTLLPPEAVPRAVREHIRAATASP